MCDFIARLSNIGVANLARIEIGNEECGNRRKGQFLKSKPKEARTSARITSRTARGNEPICHRGCLPSGRGPAGVEADQMPPACSADRRSKNRRSARGFGAMVIHDTRSPNSQL